MRHLKLLALSLAVLAFALTPIAEANKYNPKSGKKFKLLPKQKASIKVTGFQGCVFEVMHTNEGEGKGDTDSSVVSVETPGEPGKKQTVVLTALAPGLTTVMLKTEGEPGGFCDEFSAFYEVLVTPDTKSVLKQATSMVKAADKQMQGAIKAANKTFCDDVKQALALLKDGAAPLDVLLAVADSAQVLAHFIDGELEDQANATFDEVWDFVELQGYVMMDPDLVGLLPGGCGAIDDLLDRVDSAVDKLDQSVEKKFKQVSKAIEKQLKDSGETSLLVIPELPSFDLSALVPIPVGEDVPLVVAPPKPLKKNWTAAARLSSSENSTLRIGGSADPGGGDVTVSLSGPGGTPSAEVSVNGDCEWEAEFPDNVLPGSYVVTVTQGSDTVTFVTYVP